MLNFQKFTIPELKIELAKLSIPYNSKMRKADLTQLLDDHFLKRAQALAENIPAAITDVITSIADVGAQKKKLIHKKIIIPNIPDSVLLALRSNATALDTVIDPATFSNYLRAAYYYDEVKDTVYNRIGHGGLPLKEGFALKPVQIEAINFMRDRETASVGNNQYCGIKGGMLMLNMGIGKTLTSAAYSLASSHHSSVSGVKTPTLVVCTRILVDVWYSEINKFFSGVRVLRLHNDYLAKNELETFTSSSFDSYDFVVTTYEFIGKHKDDKSIEACVHVLGEEHTIMNGRKIAIRMRDHMDIAKTPARAAVARGALAMFYKNWKRVLFDESQTYSSIKTSKYVSVMCLVGEYKWCLTGTPFKNKSEDVFAQFKSIGYVGGVSEVNKLKDWQRGEAFKRDELHKVIFSKIDETTILPDINYNKIEVEFTNNNEALYYSMISNDMNNAINGHITSSITFSEILVLFMRLRQSCITPYLIGDKIKAPSADEAALIEWSKTNDAKHSSKLMKCIEIIKKITEATNSADEQIVIFSSFSESLSVFSDILDECDIGHAIIDGKSKNRDATIQDFKNNKFKVLLLTYKVGSEGLTLTNANHVVLLDPWWSDAVHKQAIGRVHRTGQTRDVEVYQLYNSATFENQMIAMCENKNAESTALFSEGEMIVSFDGLKSTGLDFNTIRTIVQKKPARIPDNADDICYVCHESDCKEGDKFIHTGCKCNTLIHASCLLEIAAYDKKGKAQCTICRKPYKLKNN
jgi:SNF2 family DNA or RNA helicase